MPTVLIGIDISEITVLKEAGSVFWGNMIYLALIGTIFSTTIFWYATQKIGAHKASSYIYLVPFFAVIIAVIILSEPIILNNLIGGLLAMTGVYLLNKKQKHVDIN